MTRQEENRAIELLQPHAIGDATRITDENKAEVIKFLRHHGCGSVADYVENLDLGGFEDWLVNDVYV